MVYCSRQVLSQVDRDIITWRSPGAEMRWKQVDEEGMSCIVDEYTGVLKENIHACRRTVSYLGSRSQNRWEGCWAVG